jgi:hypothetical protein
MARERAVDELGVCIEQRVVLQECGDDSANLRESGKSTSTEQKNGGADAGHMKCAQPSGPSGKRDSARATACSATRYAELHQAAPQMESLRHAQGTGQRNQKQEATAPATLVAVRPDDVGCSMKGRACAVQWTVHTPM